MLNTIIIETLQEYSWLGYLILFFGMIFEGESVLMLVAASSRLGIVSPYIAWTVAAAGTIFGDAFWYFMGSKVGAALMARYGKILFISEARVRALGAYLQGGRSRTGIFIILAKYLYGFTHLTMVTIGAARFPFRTFIFYTVPAAAIWVSVFFGLGFVYAHAVAELKQELPVVLAGFLALVLLIFLLSKALGKHFEKKHLNM